MSKIEEFSRDGGWWYTTVHITWPLYWDYKEEPYSLHLNQRYTIYLTSVEISSAVVLDRSDSSEAVRASRLLSSPVSTAVLSQASISSDCEASPKIGSHLGLAYFCLNFPMS